MTRSRRLLHENVRMPDVFVHRRRRSSACSTVQRDLDELRRRVGAVAGAAGGGDRAAGSRVLVRDADRRAASWWCGCRRWGTGSSRPTTWPSRRRCRRRRARRGVPVAEPSPLRARRRPSSARRSSPCPSSTGRSRPSFTPADPWLTGLPDDAARRTVWESFLDALGGDPRTSTPTALGLRAGLDRRARVVGALRRLGHRRLAAAGAGRGAGVVPRRTGPPTSRRRRCCGATCASATSCSTRTACVPRAVLDWDMASVGPAEMDLAWFLALEQVCSRPHRHGRCPASATRDEAIAVVEDRLGRRAAGPRLVRGLRPRRAPARCRPASRSCSSGPASARCSRWARTRRSPPPSDGSTPPADEPDDTRPRTGRHNASLCSRRSENGIDRHRLRWSGLPPRACVPEVPKPCLRDTG